MAITCSKYFPVRSLFLIASLLVMFSALGCGSLSAQERKSQKLIRFVFGIVKDSLQNTVPGAQLRLEGNKDTLRTIADENGKFRIGSISMGGLKINVASLGFQQKMLNVKLSETDREKDLGIVTLKNARTLLDEVRIHIKRGMVLKEDTTEFHASDYDMKKNDGVGRLLGKVEGFIVNEKSGEIKFQGKTINTIRLNGKDMEVSNLSTLLKTLPAEIVSKVQVVEDYGEEARLTGVKKGEPSKVLNLTTKDDRSVGTMATLGGDLGTNNRISTNVFLQRLNGNRQISYMGNYANTTNRAFDLPESFGFPTNSSPGYSRGNYHSLTYNDQVNKKFRIVASYGINVNKSSSVSNSYGVNNTSIGQNRFIDQNGNASRSVAHTFRAQVQYKIDSLTTLMLTPSLSLNNTENNSRSLRDNQNYYGTAFEHQYNLAENGGTSNAPRLGFTTILVHRFMKKGRLLSLNYNFSKGKSQQETNSNNSLKNYADSTFSVLLRDSLTHLITTVNSKNTNNMVRAQYVEPLNDKAKLEFNASITRNNYDNKAITDTIHPDGRREELLRLTNIYSYSLTEARLGLGYRYEQKSWQFSIGAYLNPTELNGDRPGSASMSSITTASMNGLFVLPEVMFSYLHNKTDRLNLNYTTSVSAPSFEQIQPFVNLTDPTNIVIGNPNLRMGYNHNLAVSFNTMNFKKGWGAFLGANLVVNRNQVQTNVKQRIEPVSNSGVNSIRTINETNYLNMNGAYVAGIRYGYNKQIKTKFSFNYDGGINRSTRVGMSNDEIYNGVSWNIDNRVYTRWVPNTHFEIAPTVSYNYSYVTSSLTNSATTEMSTWNFSLDGSTYLWDRLRINYLVNKALTSGLVRLGNPSPWSINLSSSFDMLPKKNLTLSLAVNDLLHQNNTVQQSVTPSGYTNMLSQNIGRYFSLGLNYNLQKWGGKAKKRGQELHRRSDGSFIE